MSSPTVGSSSSSRHGRCKQATGDLDAASLTAAQLAHLVVALIGEADPLDLGGTALCGLAMRQPVQGSMIVEVLLYRQVEIEGRLLEHDPHPPQAFRRPLADVHAEDADHTLALDVEPGGEREERCLPGAVQAEQHGKVAGCDGERDIAQHPAWPKAVPEAFDRESRNRNLGYGSLLRRREV